MEIHTIKDAQRMGLIYDIPLSEVLFCELNRTGVFLQDGQVPVNFRVRFLCDEIFSPKPPVYFAIPVKNSDKTRFVIDKNSDLKLGSFLLGKVTNIEIDTCDCSYFRKGKKVLKLLAFPAKAEARVTWVDPLIALDYMDNIPILRGVVLNERPSFCILKIMKYCLSPNYRPFNQLPYCCVPAILQWVLYRHDLDILDQETIGAELGLKLPLKGKRFFTNKNIRYITKEPKGGFGTQIEKDKYSIEQFFIKHGISLSISAMHNFQKKADLKSFLIKNLLKNNDIILRYNNKIFKRDTQKSYGHFSVIVEFDDVTEKVFIGDPEMPYFKKISLDQIIFSISDQIDGIQRGLYIVSPNL